METEKRNAHFKKRRLGYWLYWVLSISISLDLLNTLVWKTPFTMTGRLILYPITLAVGMGFFYLMNKLSSRSSHVLLFYFSCFGRFSNRRVFLLLALKIPHRIDRWNSWGGH